MESQRKRTTWSAEAACLGEDIQRFAEGRISKAEREKLRAMCRNDCPVLRECKNWATLHSDGMFIAGMTASEVRAARKRNQVTLGLEAYQSGWLEDYNCLPENLVADFESLAMYRPRTLVDRQLAFEAIPTQELDLSLPVLDELDLLHIV